jgi:hypothetical protein
MQATRDAFALGLLTEDVWLAIQDLDPDEFHKTMPSEAFPDTMLDVYHCTYGKKLIYLKFQVLESSKALLQKLNVVSFKAK